MVKSTDISIITYLLYEDLFSLDKTESNFLFHNRAKSFDPIETISYSSFLNMVCQTTAENDLIKLQKEELYYLLGEGGNYPPNKIIFHRDNLLHFISEVISKKINGEDNITGVGNELNSLRYYQSLLLINNKINLLKYKNFERELVKSFPYHIPNTLYWFYKQRIIRYNYIYQEILPQISDNKKDRLVFAINLLEKKYSIDFKGYIKTIIGLFIWFLGANEKELKSPKFNRKDISTFYIDISKFNGDFISNLKSLSKGLKGFYNEYVKVRRDEIDNDVYYYIQCFFDFPIFRVNENIYCILDFKFFIEGICAGLIWKLDSIIKETNDQSYSIQAVKEQYGYLLEEYFCFLIKRIFPDAKITTEKTGTPDSIIELKTKEGDNYLCIIEFTTKYFRISSLYNRSSDNFIFDLNRILFGKKKSDKGKFINLNKYIDKYSTDNNRVIPILLTENWIGDYDLLNRIDNILDHKILEHKLENLKNQKPLILSLDDLETFWAICTKGKEKEEFISVIEKWEREPKGRHVFNFANFISEGEEIRNDEYLELFDSSNLAKS